MLDDHGTSQFRKFSHWKFEESNVPKNTLPSTGYRSEIIIILKKEGCKSQGSYVFHESIEESLGQIISILQKYCPERTTPTFPCGVISEHNCDLSTGLDGRATFVRLAVASHLQHKLSSCYVISVIRDLTF
jgi:hypothetical protein